MCQNRGNRVFTWSKWVDDASFLVLQHCWDNPSFCRNLIKLPGMYLFIRTAAAFSELMLALHFLSRVISSFALFLLFSMFICTSLHLGPFCENTCIFTFSDIKSLILGHCMLGELYLTVTFVQSLIFRVMKMVTTEHRITKRKRTGNDTPHLIVNKNACQKEALMPSES